MKSFKPFGPSLGKGKLSKKFIKCINDKIDKSTVNKKNDYSSKLVSQINNEIKLSNSFIKNNLSNELIQNIKKYLLKSKSDKVKEIKIVLHRAVDGVRGPVISFFWFGGYKVKS